MNECPRLGQRTPSVSLGALKGLKGSMSRSQTTLKFNRFFATQPRRFINDCIEPSARTYVLQVAVEPRVRVCAKYTNSQLADDALYRHSPAHTSHAVHAVPAHAMSSGASTTARLKRPRRSTWRRSELFWRALQRFCQTGGKSSRQVLNTSRTAVRTFQVLSSSTQQILARL